MESIKSLKGASQETNPLSGPAWSWSPADSPAAKRSQGREPEAPPAPPKMLHCPPDADGNPGFGSSGLLF